MQILPVQDRSPLLLEQLLNLWERSVKASHLFLSPAEIASIKAVSYTHLHQWSPQPPSHPPTPGPLHRQKDS